MKGGLPPLEAMARARGVSRTGRRSPRSSGAALIGPVRPRRSPTDAAMLEPARRAECSGKAWRGPAVLREALDRARPRDLEEGGRTALAPRTAPRIPRPRLADGCAGGEKVWKRSPSSSRCADQHVAARARDRVGAARTRHAAVVVVAAGRGRALSQYRHSSPPRSSIDSSTIW